MYYAYSISLMYALRKKGDRHTAEAIFNKLQLDEMQKRKLHYLLENEKNKPLTVAHITRIIEPILMPATKTFMVENIKAEFISNPEATSLFSAASYGLIYYFKLEAGKDSEFAMLLAENNFNNKDYSDAEIFRVNGMTAAMKEFIKNNFGSISTEFKDKWSTQLESLSAEKKEDPFYKRNLLEDMISAKVKEFLQ